MDSDPQSDVVISSVGVLPNRHTKTERRREVSAVADLLRRQPQTRALLQAGRSAADA